MTFSLKTAHALALASLAVYQDESGAEDWAYNNGFGDFEFFDTAGTQAMVIADEDRCVLAFRGTTDLGDWMTNLDVFKTKFRYGEIHAGFHQALGLVWDDIEPTLAQYSDRQLYITGHSLGGALATLALAEWRRGELYTFGSPRVGDEEFAVGFNLLYPSYRFVNNNDVVTRVPMQGYKHVGSLRYITSKGAMWAEPNKYWLTYDRLCGRFQRKIADGVKDHSMDDYVSLLEELL